MRSCWGTTPVTHAEAATGVEGAGSEAWPQRRWAAGPGRASRRRAERQQHRKPHWCGGRRRDRRARPGFEPTRRASAALQAPPVWRGRRAWPQCWWAAAGPGRASRRRAEPKARGADGERAGRRPPAHTAAQPRGRTRRRPEQQRRHKQHSTGARTRRPAPLDATTQTQLRSTCVRCRSAHAAHRSRRSSRSPRLRRRAGPLR